MGALNPESLGASTLGYLQYPLTSLRLVMLSSGIDSELKSLEGLGAARLVKKIYWEGRQRWSLSLFTPSS